MDTLVHADIFFFVTTVAIVVVAALAIVALIYIIKILNRVHGIAKEVKEEAVLVREDMRGAREKIKAGLQVKSWVDAAGRLAHWVANRKRPETKKKAKK